MTAPLTPETLMGLADDPKRTLKECLARYMDPGAFRDSVPDRVKFTSAEQGRVVHDRLKARRATAMKRAEAAIRFFSRPENREWLDARALAMKEGSAGS